MHRVLLRSLCETPEKFSEHINYHSGGIILEVITSFVILILNYKNTSQPSLFMESRYNIAVTLTWKLRRQRCGLQKRLEFQENSWSIYSLCVRLLSEISKKLIMSSCVSGACSGMDAWGRFQAASKNLAQDHWQNVWRAVQGGEGCLCK